MKKRVGGSAGGGMWKSGKSVTVYATPYETGIYIEIGNFSGANRSVVEFLRKRKGVETRREEEKGSGVGVNEDRYSR